MHRAHVSLRGLGLSLLCAAALLAAGAPGAGELRLSREDTRARAVEMMDAGRPDIALMLAEGALLADPEDLPTLMLKARALRDLGRSEEAIETSREAWNRSDTAKERFFASLLMAQSRASHGQRGLAQFWLRRAAQVAPDERLEALAVRDFRHVRATTPWRVKLGFSVAPSDNVNGAPKTNTFSLGGLQFINPAAVPLSGVRFGLKGDFRYTIPTADRSRLHLGFGTSLERVRLSREARNKVPGARGADYARNAVETRLEWETIGVKGDWLGRAALVLARDWEGGALLADAARVELGYSRAVAQGLELGVEAAFEATKRHDQRLRDARSQSLTLRGTKRFDGGAWLRLDLTGAGTASDSAAVARDARRAVLSYGLSKPVKGVLPQIAVNWEQVEFDRPLYGPETRSDTVRGVSVNLLMPELDYMGFAPEIGVSFNERRSNYSLFESESTDLRLGIRSVF